MKKYDYGHLEEIEVHREDQKLYKFREGDFPRLRLQDIEDILLLLVQQKLTNLIIDERYDLNVALRMFTKRIVIQRRVEDLQLGVKSYQKKLNLTTQDTFSYGTLNDVRIALHDIANGIRMEYLPKRKWSGLDKQRAWVMVQDIDNDVLSCRIRRISLVGYGVLVKIQKSSNVFVLAPNYAPFSSSSQNTPELLHLSTLKQLNKQLYERKLMQNLDKFVSGREYGKDLRLIERTI
ncbi:hypothetical protein Tco_0530704 [Tanacetum coccineum]